MTDLHNKICSLASPEISPVELAKLAECDLSTVHALLTRYNLPCKKTRKWSGKRSSLVAQIIGFSGGELNSTEIATICKCSAKYVQNILRNNNKKQLPRGAVSGEKNPAYIAGRRINKGGYAKVSVDPSHPYARSLRGKNYKVIFEHRLVMEKVLGRYLLPGEIVDHIDGLTLHNDPSNLRLFATNADHVRETLKGHCPNWSEEGFGHMKLSPFLRKGVSRIDSYAESKARGEVRLIQILRAALKLGINSPYLLGTHHWLKQAQIDYSSQTKIKRALAVLCP
jgi:hypothetical protein